MARRRDRLGVSLAFGAATLWGVSSAVAASAFEVVPPARVAQARATIAAAVLVVLAAATRRLAVRRGIGGLAALGGVLAAVNATYYWAIQRLGVGPGVTIQFLGPVLVLGWMAVVQRRPVSRIGWIAGVLAVAGVGLVTEAWRIAEVDWVGIAAGLAAAGFFATYLVLGEHLGRHLPATTVMTWGFVFAAAAWAVALPPWRFPAPLEARVWGALLWVGVVGTVLPFLAAMAALRRIEAGLVGIVSTSEPVVAALAGRVVLAQTLAPLQVLGVVCVAVAVAVAQRVGVAEVPYEVAR